MDKDWAKAARLVANQTRDYLVEAIRFGATAPNGWRRGLPPGKFYEGMSDDFEVYFAPAGGKWHRRRTAEEREKYISERKARHAELLRARRTFT